MTRHRLAAMAVIVASVLSAAGCGTGDAEVPVAASASSVLDVRVVPRGHADDTPNPGSGAGDPRLAAALLTRFRDLRQWSYAPGAVVALPVVDRGSRFIPLRQVGTPFAGCEKWSAGVWTTVVNSRGVQLGVASIGDSVSSPAPLRPEGARFSEAIVTGPAVVLDRLGDPELPARCHHLSGAGAGSGSVEPLAVPPLGERSWGYRVTGSGKVRTWAWGEVIQTSRYVLEIRIPVQQPGPRTDPAELLPQIAREAYLKAEMVFR